jgi:hypothetical protein
LVYRRAARKVLSNPKIPSTVSEASSNISIFFSVMDFEQECNKSSPDQRKLKSILNYVCHIAKDVGLMLIKYGMGSGQLKF